MESVREGSRCDRVCVRVGRVVNAKVIKVTWGDNAPIPCISTNGINGSRYCFSTGSWGPILSSVLRTGKWLTYLLMGARGGPEPSGSGVFVSSAPELESFIGWGWRGSRNVDRQICTGWWLPEATTPEVRERPNEHTNQRSRSAH